MRLLDQSFPSHQANTVLKFYVSSLERTSRVSSFSLRTSCHLTSQQDDNLIAFYASALEAEDATESYAHFLKSLDLDVTKETKRSALFKAQENGLDLVKVACRTTELIMVDVIKVCLAYFFSFSMLNIIFHLMDRTYHKVNLWPLTREMWVWR
jgi:hypothetical protein